MKRTLFIIALLIGTGSAMAQTELEAKQKQLSELEAEIKAKKDQAKALGTEIAALKPKVLWKKGAQTAVNFNSVGLNNWAAGGNQSNAVSAFANLFANYKKDKIQWLNTVDLSYGIIKNDGEDMRKNEDKIDYLSKLGYKAGGGLNYSVLANFKSQFAPGFDFTNLEDPELISKFMSPAFINLSLGLDYSVASYFTIYLSPAAGKFTIVNDDSIAAKHIYIPNKIDKDGLQFYDEKFRAEFGLFFNALFNKDFGQNFNLRSRLDLFNNYTDKNRANRKNIDVNWETTINLQLTKYIGASLFTHLIYDDDVEVPTAYDIDKNPISFGPRTQFKRVVGIGFSYKFQ